MKAQKPSGSVAVGGSVVPLASIADVNALLQRKVAQLTKVVAMLNNKQEDTFDELQVMRGVVEALPTPSNRSECLVQTDPVELVLPGGLVDELRAQLLVGEKRLSEARASAAESWEAARREADAKWAQRVSLLEGSLERMEAGARVETSSLRRLLEEARGALSTQRATAAREQDTAVREAVEVAVKGEAGLWREQVRAEVELREALVRELGEAEARRAREASQWGAREQEWVKGDLQASKLVAHITELQGEVARWTGEAGAAKERAGGLGVEVEGLRATCASLRKDLEGATTTLSATRQECATHSATVAALQASLEGALGEVAAARKAGEVAGEGALAGAAQAARELRAAQARVVELERRVGEGESAAAAAAAAAREALGVCEAGRVGALAREAAALGVVEEVKVELARVKGAWEASAREASERAGGSAKEAAAARVGHEAALAALRRGWEGRLEGEVERGKATLAQTQSQLSQATHALGVVQGELGETRVTLASLQTQLSSLTAYSSAAAAASMASTLAEALGRAGREHSEALEAAVRAHKEALEGKEREVLGLKQGMEGLVGECRSGSAKIASLERALASALEAGRAKEEELLGQLRASEAQHLVAAGMGEKAAAALAATDAEVGLLKRQLEAREAQFNATLEAASGGGEREVAKAKEEGRAALEHLRSELESGAAAALVASKSSWEGEFGEALAAAERRFQGEMEVLKEGHGGALKALEEGVVAMERQRALELELGQAKERQMEVEEASLLLHKGMKEGMAALEEARAGWSAASAQCQSLEEQLLAARAAGAASSSETGAALAAATIKCQALEGQLGVANEALVGAQGKAKELEGQLQAASEAAAANAKSTAAALEAAKGGAQRERAERERLEREIEALRVELEGASSLALTMRTSSQASAAAAAAQSSSTSASNAAAMEAAVAAGVAEKTGALMAKVSQAEAATAEATARLNTLAHEHGTLTMELSKATGLLTHLTEARVEALREVKALQEKYNDLKARGESREARPEDLDRISKLVMVCKAAEVEVDRLSEETKTLRLELSNRDANYTKVFSGGGGGAANSKPGLPARAPTPTKGTGGPGAGAGVGGSGARAVAGLKGLKSP